jgi:putative transferase (TIGR04331 family)
MNKKFLITTPIEKKFVKKKERIYLGDWCLKNNEIENNYSIKSIDLNKYYFYLEKLIKRISKSLAIYLNQQSKIKFTNKFWINLIWVWLSYYLASNLYRWILIKNYSQNYKLNFVDLDVKKKFYFNDVNSYYNLISSSDIFNYLCFKRIINFFDQIKKVKIKNNIINFKDHKDHKIKPKKNFLKKIFYSIYSIFFSFFLKKNKIFITSCFSFKNLIKLNLKIKQIPFFFNAYFNHQTYYQIFEKKIIREKSSFNFRPNNKFEYFIKKNIIDDIPLSYLENFNNILNKIKKINIKPKLILSAGEHFHIEEFKIWSLYQKEINKVKLISVEHGGAHQIHSGQFNYDKIFSENKYLNWFKKKNSNTGFVNPKIHYMSKFNKNKNKILYIGYERPRYPSRLCSSRVYSIKSLNTFDNIKKLKLRLRSNFNNLYYSPKLMEDVRLKKNLNKILGRNKILPNNSLQKNLQHASYVICEYPQTAYIESFVCTPTFLVCDITKIFKPYKHLKKIYKLLESNNLLFKNVEAFLKFINKDTLDINQFWNKPKILLVRKKFEKEFSIGTLDTLLNSWEKFLKKQSYD